jgi:flavin reductase (DIM6/NTAB) family NADH-FMN oxidoreductase RutF
MPEPDIVKHFTKSDIEQMERFYRANLINAASGYKPANLIATVSPEGITNVAVFSSVVHLGADPALLAFVQRPVEAYGHTFKNIQASGYYTINHIHRSFLAQAHYTSAKFDAQTSEFEACALTPEWIAGFAAPFVEESQVKLGMRLVQTIPLELNNTTLVIGQVEHLIVSESALQDNGHLALDRVGDVAIAGLEHYFDVTALQSFPYAKVAEVPDFSGKRSGF